MTKRSHTHRTPSTQQSPDEALKAFLFRPEIIADLVNAYVYDGAQVVAPEQITPAILPPIVSERHIGALSKHPKLGKHLKCYRDAHAHYILVGVKNQALVFQVLHDIAEA
ncbi:MAG: hypothetical protein II180_00710 [Proteobacteria bacterium]|nr:hypothetical protein [Pseudomonadota bacterium]